MAYFSTLKQILDKVESDLDLKEETFIDRAEMVGYTNEAIRDAEAEIHTIYEDYFLTRTQLSLVANVAAYALPSDMYANKLRDVVYDDGTYSYKIKREKKLTEIPLLFPSDYYTFKILNDATQGRRLVLFPTPTVSLPNVITIWYLRSAKKLVNDSDVCDIIEFTNYILAHVKRSCMRKEGHPLLPDQEQQTQEMKDLMVASLTNMIVDDDNFIEQDIEMYEEMS